MGDHEQDDVYEISIFSVEQCKPDDGYNPPEPVPGFKCEDILYRAWKDSKSPFHFSNTQPFLVPDTFDSSYMALFFPLYVHTLPVSPTVAIAESMWSSSLRSMLIYITFQI